MTKKQIIILIGLGIVFVGGMLIFTLLVKTTPKPSTIQTNPTSKTYSNQTYGFKFTVPVNFEITETVGESRVSRVLSVVVEKGKPVDQYDIPAKPFAVDVYNIDPGTFGSKLVKTVKLGQAEFKEIDLVDPDRTRKGFILKHHNNFLVFWDDGDDSELFQSIFKTLIFF